MCGMTGFVDWRLRTEEAALRAMTEAVSHRGPDGEGLLFLPEAAARPARIGLGHRRLSIIDLSERARQPMGFGRLWIVFNGEIYNYREIRRELEAGGYAFDSDSDTEVALKAVHRWGTDALRRFIGMFAFALLDLEAGRLLLARDRAGVKPLYVYRREGLLLFASEPKSFSRHPDFVKEVDRESLAAYLARGYVPAPRSIFLNARAIEPGHWLSVDLDSGVESGERYWDVYECYRRPERTGLAEADVLEETESLLTSAFTYRMVSDVPVGVFLSGGYDSTAVAALLQKSMGSPLKTFTIGFAEKDFDEAPHARRVAAWLGTEHAEQYCSQKDALGLVRELPRIFDEPFGDYSALPTALLCRMARREVKVCLSADGGDELFAGYPRYRAAERYYRRFARLPGPLRHGIRALIAAVEPERLPFAGRAANFPLAFAKLRAMLSADSAAEAMLVAGRFMSAAELSSLCGMVPPAPAVPDLGRDELTTMLALDYRTYLADDILVKVDRAAMAVGLEGRDPFLDHRVVEYLAGLPASFKLRNGVSKYLLRKIVHRHVPPELMERPKAGFNVPIVAWLRGELGALLREYLDPLRLEREGLLGAPAVNALHAEFLDGRGEHAMKLWFLLVFELWFEAWMS